MQAWDYLRVQIDNAKVAYTSNRAVLEAGGEVDQALFQLGRKGWELVGTLSANMVTYQLFFKRPAIG